MNMPEELFELESNTSLDMYNNKLSDLQFLTYKKLNITSTNESRKKIRNEKNSATK